MRIRLTVFVVGLSSVIAQTLVVREGLILFGGYELVSGILLCFWLIWGGIGSMLFSVLRLNPQSRRIVSILLFVQCVCIVYAILILRCSLRIFSIPYGEVVSLQNMLVISCIALLPLCVTFGALFPAISRILEPNHVYLYEGLGAFFGGIFITFVLIHVIPATGIVLLILICLLACAFLLIQKKLLAVLSFVLLLLFVRVQDIELFLRELQMPDQNIIALDESRYGLITVTQTKEQYNFYTSGVYDFSYPDPYTTEEAVHYPLLLHEDPREVLLIGGGVSNCLQQILKHPSVQRVTYVELDPLLFMMGSRYIPGNENYGERVQIVFGDGRFYCKHTHADFDVIIVHLPDPVNAQINRFYTKEFFMESRSILKHRGIFSIRISAPRDIVSTLHAELLHTAKKSLLASYKNVIILPASQMTYIASDFEIDAHTARSLLNEHFHERALDLQYVNSYYFDFELTPEKIEYVRERIDGSRGALNSDLKPVCYYYTMILWGGVVAETVRNVFIRLFHASPWLFFLPLILVIPFYRRRSIVYVSVMSVGATEISAEVLLIILFQVFFGYVYGWIGAIIACYMLGLAMGTLLYLTTPFFKGNPVTVLSNVELTTALYMGMVLLVAVLKLSSVNFIIPVLIFFGGVMGGLHFPLSVAIVSKKKAGLVYGVDLIGSALGAIITAIILIPIIGIPFTLLFFIGLNVLVGIGLKTVPK